MADSRTSGIPVELPKATAAMAERRSDAGARVNQATSAPRAQPAITYTTGKIIITQACEMSSTLMETSILEKRSAGIVTRIDMVEMAFVASLLSTPSVPR
jgi:hypothetical protein